MTHPAILVAAAVLLAIALLYYHLFHRLKSTPTHRLTSSVLWKPAHTNGFLPTIAPPPTNKLAAAEALLAALPTLIKNGSVRASCNSLPLLDLSALIDACVTPVEAEILAERCMVVYAFLSYAYLRATTPTSSYLPRTLAIPWHAAATIVGRAPSLDYVATVLSNVHAPGGAGTATFSGLSDESYFYELHARIERAAGPAVGAMAAACACQSEQLSLPALTSALEEIGSGVSAMAALLPRMTDGCDPLAFHSSIRQSLASFSEPIVFEGVYEGGSARALRLKLGGASGAQSAILPCVDAFLGIGHSGKHELDEWSVDKGSLAHLPPPHRELLAKLRVLAPGSASKIERRLEESKENLSKAADQRLRDAHASCITALTSFRKAHFALVREFIVQPAASEAAPETPPLTRRALLKAESPVSPVTVAATTQQLVGTGGSALKGFLSGRLLDTARAALGAESSPTKLRVSRSYP